MITAEKTNRLNETFSHKKNILSVYFTAGFPNLNDTCTIIEELEKAGADIIEIGIPFSDPLADGPVIQQSSEIALRNGMSIALLFEQIKDIRNKVSIPLVLMGYLNPVLQYGIEKFCREAEAIGIDGFIIPDLPLDIYGDEYKALFEKHNLYNIFLITPQTSTERIHLIDQSSKGFIYMVSSSATTGAKTGFSGEQLNYFERIKELNLKHPTLTGFGISSNKSYTEACNYSSGVIIGSAFIKHIANSSDLKTDIHQFVKSILS